MGRLGGRRLNTRRRDFSRHHVIQNTCCLILAGSLERFLRGAQRVVSGRAVMYGNKCRRVPLCFMLVRFLHVPGIRVEMDLDSSRVLATKVPRVMYYRLLGRICVSPGWERLGWAGRASSRLMLRLGRLHPAELRCGIGRNVWRRGEDVG